VAEPVVLCLSRSGEPTAHRIAAALNLKVHGREGRTQKADAFFSDALDHARSLFASGTPIIGVCAAGILIRAVAPLLSDKRSEPPVVAVPDDGSTVIPLLGGHRGANRLARRIADELKAHAAVTTAGDVALGIALDEPPAGWRLSNPDHAKPFMATMLAGEGVRLVGECAGDSDWLDQLPAENAVALNVAATTKPQTGDASTLVFHPTVHTLGIGCARGCSVVEIRDLVFKTLAEADIAAGSIASVVSLDLKADETAINLIAEELDVPFRVFDAATLERETPRLANPSDVVFAEVGCHGVSEGAALAAAGTDATLVVEKQKTANATVAVARAPDPIVDIEGRKRGRVSLIGIGPGKAEWRTPQASRLVTEAEELIGYGLYIDLLGPLAHGKPRHDFPLGGEEDRCRFALERASEGRDVAIICSGDAGIYAMGALVFELLDRGDVSDAARRVEVISAPGVSALQGAAAKAGAPLGHDFCAISLSDLLTPRDDILRRIKAASEGDFVIAFYNPVSKKRRTLLAEARDILLKHRPADTPVLLASNLGRPEEKIVYRDLEKLDVDEVDMLTVVLIGSSQSRLVGDRMYTPRGYAKKMKAAE
jgi:cobalt-precorrin 5A hydrolase/precorrin-3B C17-methyltransferase